MLTLTDVWRHLPLRVQGFAGSIQPTTEGFTAEFNRSADEGEKEYKQLQQLLLENNGNWWQTGRSAKIKAIRRIQTICNVYARVFV